MYKRKNLLRSITCFLYAMFLLISCTNTNKLIKQTHAFSVTLYPGIVAVDEYGKEMPSNIQTKFLVYAVTGSDKIKWDTAWVNGGIYTISAEKINSSPLFEVGVDKLTGNKITISTNETEHLYLLQLKPVSGIGGTKMPIPANELQIKAIYKSRVINLVISSIKELTTPDPV